MIALLLTVMTNLSEPGLPEMESYPDAKTCGEALEQVEHDAVCHTLIEFVSPRPRRNPAYEAEK